MAYPTPYRRPPVRPPEGFAGLFSTILGAVGLGPVGGIIDSVTGGGGGGGSKPASHPWQAALTLTTSSPPGVPYDSMVDGGGNTYWRWNNQVFPTPESMKAAMLAAGATAQNPTGSAAGALASGLPGGAGGGLAKALPWIAGGLVLALVVPRLIKSRRR